MTINIHGGQQQIFEAGSNPVFNNCFSGTTPETLNLPQETSDDNTEAVLCTYIIPNDIKPMEEIEKEMAQVAKHANTLARYIKKALSLGYIDLRGDDAKTIYTNLKNHFGFKFQYRNWATYYC